MIDSNLSFTQTAFKVNEQVNSTVSRRPYSRIDLTRFTMILKNSIKIFAFACLIFFGGELKAQKTIETSFEVSGICGMCEDRIEKALDVKGVKMADYDIDSHLLTVAYNSAKISEADLHALLNAAGHDTEKSKASDEQYDTVHSCCKYRDDGDH